MPAFEAKRMPWRRNPLMLDQGRWRVSMGQIIMGAWFSSVCFLSTISPSQSIGFCGWGTCLLSLDEFDCCLFGGHTSSTQVLLLTLGSSQGT